MHGLLMYLSMYGEYFFVEIVYWFDIGIFHNPLIQM
jgi:hypothetical protein